MVNKVLAGGQHTFPGSYAFRILNACANFFSSMIFFVGNVYNTWVTDEKFEKKREGVLANANSKSCVPLESDVSTGILSCQYKGGVSIDKALCQ